jgi:hypothetical protein
MRIRHARPEDDVWFHATQRIASSNPVLPSDAPPGVDPAVMQPRSGEPLLVKAAIETVRHWKYRPTKLNGHPVEIATQIQVHFA